MENYAEKHPEDFEVTQKKLKLQFDFYEIAARRCRKFIVENRENIPDEDQFNKLAVGFFNRATEEWDAICDSLASGLTDEEIIKFRTMFDKQLGDLKEFDSRVNSGIL